MEDNLDKFVRKSFDDYEELPSDGMWHRVEAGLPQPLSFWQVYRWQMAAGFALVFMACGLLAQHFYYEDKIRTLATETPAPIHAHPQLAPLKEAPNAAPVVPNGQASETTVQSVAQPQSPDALVALENKSAHTNPLVTGAVAPPVVAKQTTRAKDALGSGAQRGQRPSTPQDVEDKTGIAADPFQQKEAGEAVPSTQAVEPAEGDVAVAPSAQRILETLPFTAYQPLQPAFPKPGSSAATPTLIKPVRTLSGWYVNLSVAPTYSREQLPAPPTTGKPGGSWGGEPRKFGNDEETTTYTTDYWLRLGKKSRHPFGFESGIGYRDLVRTAKHKPSFEFKDGRPHGGGWPHGPRRDYDFNYRLEAYGGTAEVSLRMEQTDSSITLPDKEPLDLEIETRQRVQTLRVPLLATLQGGSGPWRWGVKAGPVANFVLSNKLDIEKVCSLNNKLQPEVNTMPKPDFDHTQSFMLGYWASMNLEYRLSKNWSVVLEPSVSGNFNTQTINGRPLPRETSASIGLGVQRYF